MLRITLRKPTDIPLILTIVVAAGFVAYINYLFQHYTGYRIGLNPDSGSYIEWAPWRTPGYPALIHLIHALTGDLRWLGVVQLNLFLLSIITLADAFGRLMNSRYGGIALMVLLFGTMPVIVFSQWIMTETFFTSLVCFHLAAVCHYMRGERRISAVFIGLTVALIYLVRPAGLPFAATIPFLLLLCPKTRGRILVYAGLPMVVGLLSAVSYNGIKHDSLSLNLGGPFLAGHVAPLLRHGDGEGTRYEPLLQDLAVKSEEMTDQIAAADWPDEYWRVSSGFAVPYMWRVYLPTIQRHVADKTPGPAPFKEIHATAMDLVWIIIKAHPMGYIKHVSANYYGLWRHGFLSDWGDLPGFARGRHLETRRLYGGRVIPLYMDGEYLEDADFNARSEALAHETTLLGGWWRLLVSGKAFIPLIAFPLTLLSMALLLSRHRRRMSVRVSGYAALMLHASTLFLALVHVGLPRFTLPLTPLLFLFIVSLALIAVRNLPGLPPLTDWGGKGVRIKNGDGAGKRTV